MRELKEFDRIGEDARTRGEIRRRNKKIAKILPLAVLALAILGAFVQMPIEITLSLGVLGLILVLIAYPGFWIHKVPFVRDSKLVASVIFKCSMRGWEEDMNLLTYAGDGAELKSFVKTPYGFQATVCLRELRVIEGWENIRPSIARSFRPLAVREVRVKEEAPGTGTGRILVQLFQRPLESGGNFSYDR